MAGRHLGMFTDKLGLEGLGERMTKALRRLQDQQDEAVEKCPSVVWNCGAALDRGHRADLGALPDIS